MSKNEKEELKKRDFKGVWIPKEIYLNEELNWTEKILLIEIDSLDNEKGCYASNKYFANFLGKTKVYVSNCISKLKDKNYIYQESFDGRKRVLRSNISFELKDKAALNNSLRQDKSVVKGSPKERFKGGNPENTNHDKDESQKKPSNNTYNNTTNNKVNKKEEEEGKLSTTKLSPKTKQLFKQVYNREIKTIDLKFIAQYDLPEEMVQKALERTHEYNGKSLAYLLDILEDWDNRSIDTPEKADRLKRQFKGKDTEEDLYEQGYR